MAVPSSGELRLYADIGVELGVPQSDVSLGSMSDSAGFASPDAMSDFYGYVDALAPSVTTNAISNVGETSLRANGNITSDGGASITERGFYVGTNSASPTNNTKYTVSGTTGSYNRTISVNNNTTYYCWAFATNSVGTTYGSRVQATTIQTFVPTYTAAGQNNATIFFRNDTGSYTDFSIYYRKYYVNPYTSALVQYDSIVTNKPNIEPGDGSGYVQPGYGSNASNFVNNAQNNIRVGHTQSNSGNIYAHQYYLNIERYASNSLTNRATYKSSSIPSVTVVSGSVTITVSAQYQTISGNAYMGATFDY